MRIFGRLAERFPDFATAVLVVGAVIGGSMLSTLAGCADFGFSQGEQVLIHGQLPALPAKDKDGKLIPNPAPVPFTLVTYDQWAPSWLLATNKLHFSYIVKGDVSEVQLAAVAEGERTCRIYTNASRPNELVGALANGVLYAGVNFPVGGIAATAAFRGASFLDYAAYSGIAYGGGGLATGIVQIGGKIYTFANCGRGLFDLFPSYEVQVLTPSPY